MVIVSCDVIGDKGGNLTAFPFNVNVNVHVYSPDIPVGSADCTIYTLGIGTHSFSLISSRENSAFGYFVAAIANHYNLVFSFHQVPITAGWTYVA